MSHGHGQRSLSRTTGGAPSRKFCMNRAPFAVIVTVLTASSNNAIHGLCTNPRLEPPRVTSPDVSLGFEEAAGATWVSKDDVDDSRPSLARTSGAGDTAPGLIDVTP